MKVTQPFPNFIQGVSQQPPALRLPSHDEELVNAYASAEEGLTKRPNTEHIALLASTSSATAKIHSFNKSENERGYIVLKGDGTLTVKGFDGVAASVTMTAANTYINGVANPATDFELITVADYTFIVNRNVVPALKADTWPNNNITIGYDTMVWVQTANLDTPYSIQLTGVLASYNPGTTSANAQTINIASQLQTLVNGAGPGPTYGAATVGSVIMIGETSAAPYDIDVMDGRGNAAMLLLRGATGSPANLPPTAPNGYHVEITGSEDTQWDNYFVEFDSIKKVWYEIPKPGRAYKIDPATMPHILRYVSPGVYAFERITWNDCLCGDTTTNPDPSFIGNRINDMFFYRGRLGFMTDKSVCLSEAGNLYNFYRTTVTALVDSDPLDTEVTMTDPAPLRWAVEYDDTVFFISSKQQYYIEPNVEVLAPRTFAVRAPTNYEVDVTSQPIVVGDRMYYARQRALHSSLHDYRRATVDQNGRRTYASDEVTRHCPRYILGRIKQLKGNAQGDAVFILTDQDDEKVYVFQTQVNEQGQRLQAALHRWEFDASNSVLTAEANGSAMYFLLSRSDGIFLEECDLSPKDVDDGMPIKLLLDQRLDETDVTSVTYSSTTGLSTITLPRADSNSATNPYVMYGRGSSVLAKPGEAVPITITATSPSVIFTVEGDWRTDDFYVGKNYTFSKEFSPIVPRDRTTGAPITGGRTQVSRIFVNYGDTGYFRAIVTPGQRETFTYPLSAQQLGSSDVLIGDIPLRSGTFKFPVRANALNVSVRIVSDTPFPLKLLNGDWEGEFGSQAVQAARRL